MATTCNTGYLTPFVRDHEYKAVLPAVQAAHQTLHGGDGPGKEFLGWLDLPVQYDKEEFDRVKKAAARIRKNSRVLVVIGIGGSYLGARAAIEFVKSNNYNLLPKETPEIYFAGNTISPSALSEVIALCEGRDFSVNVISKSGTTTEPALAFRIFRAMLEKKYGRDGAKQRIYCTTDKARGTLKELAEREGYESFAVPDDVGGRFSVLTAVGLLPIAAAGCDIDALMRGAQDAREAFAICDLKGNDCYRYAATRHILRTKGKGIEVLVSYEPSFVMMAEWYKQLFGESEGKDQKGIFPASMNFSTDLHSLGQFVQDGARTLFETAVNIKKPRSDLFIEPDAENLDGLNFLSGQNMSVVNQRAMQGTMLAHIEGGAPNIVLEVPDQSEYELGYLFYFFEKACAISGYMQGVNPFDQPGVEQYKRNMFALLGKPGYEAERAALEEKL